MTKDGSKAAPSYMPFLMIILMEFVFFVPSFDFAQDMLFVALSAPFDSAQGMPSW
jgi:hypothetical protein